MRKLLYIAPGCLSKGEVLDPTYEKRIEEQKTDTKDASSEEGLKEPHLDLNPSISRTEAKRRGTNRKREAAVPQKGTGP